MQLQQIKHTVTFYKAKTSDEPSSCPPCTQVEAAYLKHAFDDWGNCRWQMAMLGDGPSGPGGPLHQPLMTICDI